MKLSKPVLLIAGMLLSCFVGWQVIRSGASPAPDSDPIAQQQTDVGGQKSSPQDENPAKTFDVTQQTRLAATTVPGFSNDRFHQSFKHDLDRLNPTIDGWDTEAFSDLAMSQLKNIGKHIEAPESVSATALAKLVTPQFRCATLLPKLKVEFEDAHFVVRRETKHSNQMPHSGSTGFAQVLAALNEAYRPVHPHAHFKIFRVEKLEREVRTSTYFQLGGSTLSQGTQVNAIWHCVWVPGEAGEAPKLHSLRIEDYAEVVTKKSRQRRVLSDCTESVLGRTSVYREQMVPGLDHWGARIDRRFGIDIVGVHGLALGDVDGDGLDDLYCCEPGGLPNRLFLHKADGTARDVSAVAKVDYLESTRAALFLDLDNDGDQDLVLATDRFVILLDNDGFGRFSQRDAIRTNASLTSLTSADYDLDGDLDVYVCGYFTKEEDAESAVGLGNPIPFHDANNGTRNVMLRNDGLWKFSDVTDQIGLGQDNNRFSLAAAWEDYDNDGDADLYVANDYGRNCLYRNDDGHFTNVAAAAGVEDISAGMSISWGDYNQDGKWDIYVSNMFSSAGNRISYQRQFKSAAQQSTRSDYQRFAHGNTLFENVGDGTFRDVTNTAGVTLGRWAWASDFIDVNNDGWEDLFVANGMLTRDDTGDL